MISRDSAILGRTTCTTENRGVPGSSPGLAMAETRMVSRLPVLRVRRSALESALDLGLIRAWAPENRLRGPIGRARAPHRHWGFAPSRIEPTTIPVVVVPSSSRHAAVRRSSTAEIAVNGVVSELAVGQAGEWRSGRGAAAAHPRHALTAGRHRDARTHAGDPVRSRRSQSMRSCTPTRR
jgi:hypothetical protein